MSSSSSVLLTRGSPRAVVGDAFMESTTIFETCDCADRRDITLLSSVFARQSIVVVVVVVFGVVVVVAFVSSGSLLVFLFFF